MYLHCQVMLVFTDKNVMKKETRILRNAVSRLPALFHKIEVNL